MPGFILQHWFNFNYAPTGQPFYDGAVWPNVFVILVVAPLGYLWSKTKFWPLRPISHAITKLHEKVDAVHVKLDAHSKFHDEHAESLTALHDKLDRLLERKDPK